MHAYRWQLVKVSGVERAWDVDGDVVGALRCWLIARSGLDIDLSIETTSFLDQYLSRPRSIYIYICVKMEASKSRDETVDMLPFVRREHDDEKRRHVRFPGSGFVLAFVMAFFCAACLTITLRSAAQVSDLQERMERLERDVKWSTGEGLHRSSSVNLEEGDVDDVS